MEHESTSFEGSDAAQLAGGVDAPWPADGAHADSSWLRDLDRVDADVFVLHQCLELPIEDAASWAGVSVDEARGALARCSQHLAGLGS